MSEKSWREEAADRLDDMVALRPTPGSTISAEDNPFWRSLLPTNEVFELMEDAKAEVLAIARSTKNG